MFNVLKTEASIETFRTERGRNQHRKTDPWRSGQRGRYDPSGCGKRRPEGNDQTRCGGSRRMMPKDPVMLLSYVNTQLRDFYPSLAEFCAAMQTEESDLREKLALIDYEYDEKTNQFV